MIDLPAWTPLEVAWMRALLGAALLLWPVTAVNEVTEPVGVLRHLRLGDLLRDRRTEQARRVLIALFVVDLAAPLPAVGLALVTVGFVTLANSGGVVNHGHHMTAIATVTYAAADVARWARDTWDLDWSVDHTTAAGWTVQAIAALYLTSGASKLIASRGHWARQGPNLTLAVIAKDYQLAAESDRRHGFVATARRHPTVVAALLPMGLALELLVPLGLLHPTALFAVGVAVIALHLVNGALLDLSFPPYRWIVATHFVLFSLPLG